MARPDAHQNPLAQGAQVRERTAAALENNTRPVACTTATPTGADWSCTPSGGYPLNAGTSTCVRAGTLANGASAAVLKGVPIEKLWNPEFLVAQMTSALPPPGATEPLIASAGTRAAVAIIAVVGIIIATVSVNIAANVVSPANDFANLAPKYISFQTGGLITGILGIVCMPWKLMADPATYIGGWLTGVSALLGPIAGIMIADYFILRKTELDVPDLYREKGRYGGVNPAAMLALAAGVAPNLPGFLKGIHVIDSVPAVFDGLYIYAWFTGFFLSGAVYLGVSKLVPPKTEATAE